MSKQTVNGKLNIRTETGDRVFSCMASRISYLVDGRTRLEKLTSEIHEIIKNTPDEKFIGDLNLSGESLDSSEEAQ